MLAARRALGLLGALALGLLGTASAASVGPVPIASAATTHRAAVIVDTGSGVQRVVITFTEDSITGIEALRRANANPVVYTFNGQGGAVCRLFGVGRDAGPNCLGGQDGDARYWAYFRAPAGTSSFSYSRVGAGTAEVRDGDVEGWRFGTGAAPEYVSLQSLLPPPPPPPPPDPDPSAPPVTGAAPPGSGPGPAAVAPAAGTGAPGRPGAAGAASSSSTLPLTGASGAAGATDAKRGSKDAPDSFASRGRSADDQRTAAQRQSNETALASSTSEQSSSASSLVWFAALLAAIGVAIVFVRRVRRRRVA